MITEHILNLLLVVLDHINKNKMTEQQFRTLIGQYSILQGSIIAIDFVDGTRRYFRLNYDENDNIAIANGRLGAEHFLGNNQFSPVPGGLDIATIAGIDVE